MLLSVGRNLKTGESARRIFASFVIGWPVRANAHSDACPSAHLKSKRRIGIAYINAIISVQAQPDRVAFKYHQVVL